MKPLRLFAAYFLPALLVGAALTFTPLAHADTIAWAHWTQATSGSSTPGSATGTINSSLYGTITVTYSGQTSGLLTNYPSWTPVSTFTGGVVGNAPPASNNVVQLEGGQTYNETITFSTPVADPIFAIWSLGAGGTPAYFNFSASDPFNDLGGGPSAEYGGTGLVISGNSIFGKEGNGIVQFIGTYSSLTFTTPDYEGYYAFTIGEDSTLTDNPPGTPSTVPEPATLSLFGMGLTALPLLRRKLLGDRA
ncbi:MAG: PEP-CTERM sorting domain-containing protein [Acidobacteria bacterium]|nr:PEP-CTERM sorting domain-containing protein [Acidobacteriota bacterium]